jgi:hypothetical protein
MSGALTEVTSEVGRSPVWQQREEHVRQVAGPQRPRKLKPWVIIVKRLNTKQDRDIIRQENHLTIGPYLMPRSIPALASAPFTSISQ